MQIGTNAGGMRGSRDPEYLHQLRVGMRRLRSAIQAFAPLFTDDKPLKRALRRLAPALGPARDFDVLHDGTRRLLWTRPDQGESILWVLDRALNLVREVTNTASAPAQGWFSSSYAKLADGSGRLIWFNPTAKTAVSWPLGTGDTLGTAQKKTYQPPGAAGDWVPVAYTAAPDGTGRLLWSLAAMSNGTAPTIAQAEVWFLDPLDDKSTLSVVTYDQGWFARSYHVERGGRVRMLWGNDTTGSAIVCTYKSDAKVETVPAAEGWGDDQCQTFTQTGWVARTFTREDCAWDDVACPAPCVDDVKLPLDPEPPAKLSETGLYSNIANKTIAPYAKAYQPRFPLWSDGAEKERHVYIPKCSKVDTSDMDHWVLPVGTRVWKQFTRDGVLVETRLIHRYGPRTEDWIFAPYQWGTSSTNSGDADHVPDGVPNANGTTHDIPSQAQCVNCHEKMTDRVLSFSAVQLSHSLPGETMASLSAAGILTVPRPGGVTVPGNATEHAALGYLHANCGNCHNSSFTTTDLRLRFLSTFISVQATDAYTTTVNFKTKSFNCGGSGVGTCDRVEPGDAAHSAIIMRMSNRGTSAQMPPIASEVVHAEGVKAVSDWINAISP